MDAYWMKPLLNCIRNIPKQVGPTVLKMQALNTFLPTMVVMHGREEKRSKLFRMCPAKQSLPMKKSGHFFKNIKL